MGMGDKGHALADLPRERLGTHSIGDWMGPRARLDGCGKSRPHQDSIPGPSSPYRRTALSCPLFAEVVVNK